MGAPRAAGVDEEIGRARAAGREGPAEMGLDLASLGEPRERGEVDHTEVGREDALARPHVELAPAAGEENPVARREHAAHPRSASARIAPAMSPFAATSAARASSAVTPA